MYYLDHRQPWLWVKFRFPKLSYAFVQMDLDKPVIRIHHWNKARVGGPLNIILPAKRMEPSAWTPDVPTDESERNEAPCVICAMGVLAYSHAPENHSGLCLRYFPGDLSNFIGFDATNWLHFSGVNELT